MQKLIILVAAALVLVQTGCVHQYKVQSNERTETLKPSVAVVVAVPKDGKYEDNDYPGSGEATARALASAFSKHANRAVLEGDTSVTPYYRVIPFIAHWEDRATEWSGISDKIRIDIQTIRVSDDVVVARGRVEGKSKWGTFGGDHPHDLLQGPIDSYVDWLYSPMGTVLATNGPAQAKPANKMGAHK